MNLYFSRKFTYSPTYSLCSTDVLSGEAGSASEPAFLGQGKPRNVGSNSRLGYMNHDSRVTCTVLLIDSCYEHAVMPFV